METKELYFYTNELVGNSKIKILYDGKFFHDNSSEVYIHYGFGSDWINGGDIKMDKTNKGFIADVTLDNSDTLYFCFKNGKNEWDNNNGKNYIYKIEKVSQNKEIENIKNSKENTNDSSKIENTEISNIVKKPENFENTENDSVKMLANFNNMLDSYKGLYDSSTIDYIMNEYNFLSNKILENIDKVTPENNVEKENAENISEKIQENKSEKENTEKIADEKFENKAEEILKEKSEIKNEKVSEDIEDSSEKNNIIAQIYNSHLKKKQSEKISENTKQKETERNSNNIQQKETEKFSNSIQQKETEKISKNNKQKINLKDPNQNPALKEILEIQEKIHVISDSPFLGKQARYIDIEDIEKVEDYETKKEESNLESAQKENTDYFSEELPKKENILEKKETDKFEDKNIFNSAKNTSNQEQKQENKKEETYTMVKSEDVANEINQIKETYPENTLIISATRNIVLLPYKIDDILKTLKENPDKYQKLEDVITEEYIYPYSHFKNLVFSRFREAFKFIRQKEHGSIKSALDLATELIFNYDLHPAIIAACRNIDELDIYLDYLSTNETNKFNCFDIKYEIAPDVKHVFN